MWIDQICRLCAQSSEVLFPIFDKEGERPRLDLKIRKCLSLVIAEEDCKPKHVCYNCATKLDDYYDFLETCLNSDYKFETLLFAPPPKLILEQTLTGATPHDGVIVIGKSDEMQSRDCQDILLMVELKNLDESEIIQTESGAGNVGVLRHSHMHTDSAYNNNNNNNNNNNSSGSSNSKKCNGVVLTPLAVQSPSPLSLPSLSLIPSSPTSQQKQNKPFPCGSCNKSFMRRSSLNAHMSTHTQIRPYACAQCDRAFAVRWNLTIHERIHTGVFSCEFCGKNFPVRGKLERHVRTHTGERPFACDYPACDKAFSDKRNLEAHLRTHSEERPFVCGVCTKAFRSRSHLSDHRRVHSSDAPFTCDACGKSFKWKTNLTIHLRSHTGEKSACPDCGKLFSRTSLMTKHRRTHHNDQHKNV